MYIYKYDIIFNFKMAYIIANLTAFRNSKISNCQENKCKVHVCVTDQNNKFSCE